MAKSMFRSRKADFNVMVAVLGTVIVMLVLLVLGYQIYMKSDDVGDDEKCRLSFFANAGLARAKAESGGIFSEKVAYECPRKFMKVKLNDVKKYGKINDDKMKTLLANEMKRCWSMTGGGKFDTARGGSWDLKEKYCLVCTEIVFDEKLLKKAVDQKYELKGFQYWAAAHILPGQESTLYEYLKNERPTPDLLAQLKASEDNPDMMFNIFQKYVVVWRFEIYETGWASTFTTIAGVVGATVGAIILFPITGVAATVIGAAALIGGVISFGVGVSSEEIPDWVPAWALKPGASVGFGIHRKGEADVYQEVFITPEDTLSTQFNFDSGKKDFCTIILN
ncbi:hypothetical protein HZB90_00355 [archaeon]|nr:hypothetical protein [archaeon]